MQRVLAMMDIKILIMWYQQQIHFLFNVGLLINNFRTLFAQKYVLNSHWFYWNIQSFKKVLFPWEIAVLYKHKFSPL